MKQVNGLKRKQSGKPIWNITAHRAMWLLVAGVEGVDPRQGPFFTDSALVIQAAVEGQGVALARGALAAGDIAAGRLVKPFDIALPTEYAYYVLTPKATANRPKIAAFRAWLLEEVEDA